MESETGNTAGFLSQHWTELLGLLSLIPIVPLGVYMWNRLWPYSVSASMLAIEGTRTDTVYLRLTGTILSRLAYREGVYASIPKWSNKRYPIIRPHPLDPTKPLVTGNRVLIGDENQPLSIQVFDVPPAKRADFKAVLACEGAYLVVVGGWRRRYPVRKKVRLTGKTKLEGYGYKLPA